MRFYFSRFNQLSSRMSQIFSREEDAETGACGQAREEPGDPRHGSGWEGPTGSRLDCDRLLPWPWG